MLYVGDGACDERCRKALYLTRQSRIALNKDMDRIQRVFLVTGTLLRQRVPRAGAPGPAGTEAARDRTRRASIEPIPAYADGPVGSAGRIYLVDPLGNLMMSYPRSGARQGAAHGPQEAAAPLAHRITRMRLNWFRRLCLVGALLALVCRRARRVGPAEPRRSRLPGLAGLLRAPDGRRCRRECRGGQRRAPGAPARGGQGHQGDGAPLLRLDARPR